MTIWEHFMDQNFHLEKDTDEEDMLGTYKNMIGIKNRIMIHYFIES